MLRTEGIHHITAYVNDVQSTVDFYAGLLGLRLVKRTVNYDAPQIYHLYFGNQVGSPGTIMTFFPQPNARQGSLGGGQVGIIVYAVPPGSLLFWRQRLKQFGVHYMETKRYGEDFIRFADHAGLLIDLVERKEGPMSRWSFSGIPLEHAIKGFGGAMLFSAAPEQTAAVLQELLGMEPYAEEEGLIRFRAAGQLGNWIDLNVQPIPCGEKGAGIVHHLAWRVKSREEQLCFRDQLISCGLEPTPVVDRQYFRAMYFREPGGILFEVATDPPGFELDEPGGVLGQSLMLPDELEEERASIERKLPSFEVRELG
ncbi:ring-cleaving dioxygenase [Paenibacillus sp. CAA11]|uniref:VOC family protein n=1 Tax=Paenibacillus sp. CAA11 TaxID=1532905 RepID=UPI000D333960|nr:VOC family protein [Paenibacillus sp. CAA11]AWB43397.1 ring-cleaving dioxygenase [Paenibacillus sp. CAA11]